MEIVFTSGPRAGERIVLPPGPGLVLGRDVTTDVRLEDTEVSRRHIRIRVEGDGVIVEDLGSTNGTYVDGQRITAPARLNDGETFRIGSVVLRLDATAVDPALAVASPPPDSAPRAPGTATLERAFLRASVASANRTAQVAIGVAVAVVAAVGVLGFMLATGAFEPSRPEIIARLQPAILQINVEAAEGFFGGTGWVLDAGEGLIVTNEHVIDGALVVTVSRVGMAPRPAEIVGAAYCDDLALLRVEDTSGLETMPLGSQSDLRQGDPVLVLGYPGNLGPGDDYQAADGIVSVVHTRYDGGPGSVPYPNLIQTDAAINSGNSGGPLVTLEGKLVGVNSLAGTQSDGELKENQGYAIGLDHVMDIVAQLRQGRSLGWTGAVFEYPSNEEFAELGLPLEDGIVVTGYTGETPAADVGLGDVPALVQAIDGEPMSGRLDEYCEAYGSRSAEDTTFSVREAGSAPPATVELRFR